MSSRAVRIETRKLLTAPAVAALCPFYETINIEQNPTQSIWFTVSFNFEYQEKLSLCNDFLEYGTIELIFEASAGTGDDAVFQAAEAVTAELKKFSDPSGKLTLVNFNPPDEFSAGGANESAYRVAVDIEYVFSN